ncbi:MAG TPA: hypothetical protein PKL77_07255 [Candidatus Omnitrophota bacterium]|nr:hypothetical protein [Candidatus Omnitrophota bacterium]
MNDKYYYSPSHNAFYLENVSPEIPDDVMEITEAEHQSLLRSLNEDQKSITVKNGKITLVDQVRTAEEINAGLKSQLESIDTKSLRAVRSVLAAMHSGEDPDERDIAKLAEYEADAAELRSKLK